MKKSKLKAKATGTCFDDVNDVMYSLKLKEGKSFELEKCFIVHSLCKWKSDKSGRLFAHAWVEYKDIIHEVKLIDGKPEIFQFTQDFEDFPYEVVEKTKYTLPEALIASAKYRGESGPWIEKYRRHCKDIREDGIS